MQVSPWPFLFVGVTECRRRDRNEIFGKSWAWSPVPRRRRRGKFFLASILLRQRRGTKFCLKQWKGRKGGGGGGKGGSTLFCDPVLQLQLSQPMSTFDPPRTVPSEGSSGISIGGGGGNPPSTPPSSLPIHLWGQLPSTNHCRRLAPTCGGHPPA